MKIADLGVLDGPVVVFGGPYSNAQATRALFDNVRHLGVAPDHVISTGDVVAYCGDPLGTVDLIRASGATVVAGNCERQFAARALDCGCGFEQGSACDVLSARWFAFADRALRASDRRWMATCPDVAVFRHQGKRAAVIHGGVTEISRFLWPTSDRAEFQQEIDALKEYVGGVDMIIAGHCGLPFQISVGGVHWVNAGVIGMPPHDGRQMTRFAVLDGGEVAFHPLHYDVAGAVQDMREAGLPPDYAQALSCGYWPSDDILPAGLRGASLASG